MVTLHEVITFLVSMQISISSLQTHNVNRCGRSRHLARKLSLRRKRSSPNVFEMAATETITDRKSVPRTPGNNVYVGFMVWSNFTATKCRGLVSLNQVIKEIICLQPLK